MKFLVVVTPPSIYHKLLVTNKCVNQRRSAFKRRKKEWFQNKNIYFQKYSQQHFAAKPNQNTMVAIYQCLLKLFLSNIFLRGGCSRKYLSYKSCSIFYSFMSDDSSQGDLTTASHKKKRIKWFYDNNYSNTTIISIQISSHNNSYVPRLFICCNC